MWNQIATRVGCALIAIGLLGSWLPACSGGAKGPVKIGVLLPLTGPNENDFNLPLNMALKRINAAGGVRGHQVELVYSDLGRFADTVDGGVSAAQQFLNDDSIQAVIGTDQDDTTDALASAFIDKKKLLVSPSATTRELIQQFGGEKYFWRTVESDVSQAEVMLEYAFSHGATSVAVLATSNLYGQTFFDAIPDRAVEVGLQVTGALRIGEKETDCAAAMQRLRDNGVAAGRANALAKATDESDVKDQLFAEDETTNPDSNYYPDWLYLVPRTEDQATCMIEQARKLFAAKVPQLFFPDGGQYKGLWKKLVAKGEDPTGILGTSVEAATSTGFEEVFSKETGVTIPGVDASYSAQAFDALMMIAYAMQRANLQTGEKLAQAFWDLATLDPDNSDVTIDWQDIGGALDAIAAGKRVYVTGATGNLQWDEKLGVDLLETTYAVWRIDGEKQVYNKEDYFVRGKGEAGVSAVLQTAAAAHRNKLALTGDAPPPPIDPAKDVWALVGATSSGIANYRHQADALRFFHILRTYGVPRTHIILFLADDILTNPKNPTPGKIENVPNGPDLYAPPDYYLSDLTKDGKGAKHILEILAGEANITRNNGNIGPVIQSNDQSNVVVFIVGHGGDDGVLVGGDTSEAAESGRGSFITPRDLGAKVNAMHTQKRYRELWMIVEACHAGVLGRNFNAPLAFLITGANAHENSFAANYDRSVNTWVADEFAAAFSSQLEGAANPNLHALYNLLYNSVKLSHVSAFNAGRFVDPRKVPASDFVRPPAL